MGVLAGTGASVQQYKDLTIAAMGLKAGDVQAIVCDKLLAENLCTINDGLKCFEATYADGSSTLEQCTGGDFLVFFHRNAFLQGMQHHLIRKEKL